MPEQGTAPGLTVPKGGLLIEVILALMLLAISSSALALLLRQTMKQVHVNEQVSELLPPLSAWIVDASPGDRWMGPAGAQVQWDPEGWIRMELLRGDTRTVPWVMEPTHEQGAP